MPIFNFDGKAFHLRKGVYVPVFPEEKEPWWKDLDTSMWNPVCSSGDSPFLGHTHCGFTSGDSGKMPNEYLSFLMAALKFASTPQFLGHPPYPYGFTSPPIGHLHAPTATEAKMRTEKPLVKQKGKTKVVSSLDRLRKAFWDIGKFKW